MRSRRLEVVVTDRRKEMIHNGVVGVGIREASSRRNYRERCKNSE
jgi:hypothetical protein